MALNKTYNDNRLAANPRVQELTPEEIELISGGMGMTGQRILSGVLTGVGVAVGAFGGPLGMAAGGAAGAAIAYAIIS